MFHGGGSRICLAKGADGKIFARQLMLNGKSELFTEGTGTRDATLLRVGGGWNACRTASLDKKVAFGGAAGPGPSSAECPFVCYRQGSKHYYLSRAQRYANPPQTSVYRSKNPADFGVDDDRYLVGAMPVAAPELIEHEGRL
jgi:hypothetical protein